MPTRGSVVPAEMRRGTRGSSQSVRWARHSIVPSSAHLLCVFIGLWSSFSLSPAPFAGAYVLQLHPAGLPATFHTSHLCVQQRRLSCVLPTRLAARRSDIRQVLSALVPCIANSILWMQHTVRSAARPCLFHSQCAVLTCIACHLCTPGRLCFWCSCGAIQRTATLMICSQRRP